MKSLFADSVSRLTLHILIDVPLSPNLSAFTARVYLFVDSFSLVLDEPWAQTVRTSPPNRLFVITSPGGNLSSTGGPLPSPSAENSCYLSLVSRCSVPENCFSTRDETLHYVRRVPFVRRSLSSVCLRQRFVYAGTTLAKGYTLSVLVLNDTTAVPFLI